MVIPSGVNQIEFFKAAKAKGISVTSRYKGVHAHPNGSKDINWVAQKSEKGTTRYIGKFPFTEQGELIAHLAYERNTKTDSINA